MFLRSVFATLGVLAAHTAAAEPPRVVASIKPVHSLVAAVMEGIAAPELLVQGGVSPHVYSLKPSDARKLSEAQLVFWIGPSYEAFLERPLASLADGARIVTLAEAPKIVLLAGRKGGSWEPDEHGHDHPQRAEETDGHIWLDPANARAMVEAIAQALAETDPADAERYRNNAAATTQLLDALDAELSSALEPVRQVPYLVFHDGYQYLERRYGLNAVGSVTVSAESRPGARRVSALRGKVVALGARCVFAEPQFEPALVDTLVAGTPARRGTLDPLGADIADGPALYATVMRRIAASLRDCLG
jgi:zinc transport system substrate-binding protein